MPVRPVPATLALLSALTLGIGAGAAHAATPPPADGWHAAWGRAQSPASAGPALVNQTVRVVARSTGGGSEVRIRVQNAFGKGTTPTSTTPVTVDAATVAIRTTGAAVDPATLRPVTFGGNASVTVAPGAWVDSDPVALAVAPGQDVAISLHTPNADPPAHLTGTETNYLNTAGNATADASATPFTKTTTSVPLLAALDVRGTPIAGTVGTIGGSVVDGVGSTLDGHDAWPDDLSRRLQTEVPAAQRKAVTNAGIAGTTAAAVCASASGPAAEDRLQRDVLSLAGVTDLIVYAGTNDLAGGCNGDQIIAAYRNIVGQAHAAGVSVLITTITPRASYGGVANGYRDQVNAWIRAGGNCSGGCDHALDFDAAIRDPAQPTRMDPKLDSGDGIHPNPAGYKAIADSIDLAALAVPAVAPAPVVTPVSPVTPATPVFPAVPTVPRTPAKRPTLTAGLRVKRSGRGYLFTASLRGTVTGRIQVRLRRTGKTVLTRRVTLRRGSATVRFTASRAGRYSVQAIASPTLRAVSRTLVVRRP